MPEIYAASVLAVLTVAGKTLRDSRRRAAANHDETQRARLAEKIARQRAANLAATWHN